MTPRQFALLSERHREALVHRELHLGPIRSAVINCGPYPPEKPASPIDTMFSHREHTQAASQNPADAMDDATLARVSAYNLKKAQLAAERAEAAQREGTAQRTGTPRRKPRKKANG